MKKLELVMLLILPFAMNGQNMDSSFSETNYLPSDLSYPSVGTTSKTWSSPMMMVDPLPTEFSSKWGS